VKENEVAILKNLLKSLDEEYRQDRSALLRSIEVAIRKQAGGRRSSNDHGVLPAETLREPLGDPARPETSLPKISVAKAVREAISKTTGEFTISEIRQYIRQYHPELYQHSSNVIGARLWEATEDGIIETVKPGKGGRPNTYIRAQK
jgi:hypothetical protein